MAKLLDKGLGRVRLVIWLCFMAGTALPVLSVAHAGGFGVRQQSAYGQGTSFAGMAAGGSLSSMFWNPANLSDVDEAELEATATVVLPTTEVNLDPVPALGFPGSHEGNIAHDEFVPSGYAAYRLTDRFVFGLAVNSPFGLVSKYSGNSILNSTGVAGASKIFALNVNPAISFDVTDWLAVAVGAQIEYLDVRLSGQALGPLGTSLLEGNDIGYGFTAGIRLMPMQGTVIGIGYRSFIDHELDGTLETSNAGNFDVGYDNVALPDIVSLGVRQEITDRFRVMAGAEWWNWSRLGTVNVEGGPAPIALSFDYDDGWFVSVGGEFDVTPEVAVRSGVGYEFSPIDGDVRTYRLPDNNRLWISAGASYRVDERLSFDVGYSFIDVSETNILAAGAGGPAGNGPFSGESKSHVHSIAAAIKVKLN